MDKNVQFSHLLQIYFWRLAASLTGLAVQNQQSLRRAAWVAPVLLAGVAAYFLGRMFGTLLLWTLAL